MGAGAIAMLPFGLANPTDARAEGYCAAQCLDAGKCGEPHCGDPKRSVPAQGACQGCRTGFHCCVCRDYNDGKPLPNVLVNGGYSCTTYCTQLGFTVISDTPC